MLEETCSGCKHLSYIEKIFCSKTGLNLPSNLERSEECKEKGYKATGIFHIDIKGIQGNSLRVVYILSGVQFPNHSIKSSQDTIEFYDPQYNHTPDGQFISRYNVGTLMNPNLIVTGMDLCAGEADWKIESKEMKLLQNWISYKMKSVKH